MRRRLKNQKMIMVKEKKNQRNHSLNFKFNNQVMRVKKRMPLMIKSKPLREEILSLPSNKMMMILMIRMRNKERLVKIRKPRIKKRRIKRNRNKKLQPNHRLQVQKLKQKRRRKNQVKPMSAHCSPKKLRRKKKILMLE